MYEDRKLLSASQILSQGTYSEQAGWAERVDPVFVPQGLEQLPVQGWLEVGHVKGVVAKTGGHGMTCS